MRLGRHILSMAAAVVLLAGSLLAASGATIPLASFSQLTPGVPVWHYHENPGVIDGSFDVTAGTQVIFNSLTGALPVGAGVVADMTVTGTAVGPAVSGGFGTPAAQFVNFEIRFTRAGNPLDLLLDVVATGNPAGGAAGGQYEGTDGGTTADIRGSDFGLPSGSSITYTSNYAGFADLNANPPGYGIFDVIARDLSISLNGLDVPLTVGPDSDYLDHNATVSGVFGYTPNVPEPGTIGMLLGLGVSGSLFGLKLRRRA